MSAPIEDVSWDEIRFVVAIARAGTLRAAGAELGVNHATISRHVGILQQRLGVRLFDRRGRKLELTPAGAELLAVGQDVETRILEVSRRLAGQDLRLEGTVRVAIMSTLVPVLAPRLPEFLGKHPGIGLEFVTGLSFKSFTRREVDVAVRIVEAPQETLIGRRLANFEVAAFGTRALLDAIEPCALGDYPWLGWPRRYAHFPMERWLQDAGVVRRLVIDSEEGMFNLVRGGVGTGFIPCLLGDHDKRLRRLSPTTPVFSSALWILTHADLRAAPRVQAVMEWLGDQLGPIKR